MSIHSTSPILAFPGSSLAQGIGWRRGSVVRASVFDWRTYPDLRRSMADMWPLCG